MARLDSLFGLFFRICVPLVYLQELFAQKFGGKDGRGFYRVESWCHKLLIEPREKASHAPSN